MKNTKYLTIFLLMLIIPMNIYAAESTIISKNGKYDTDLYTKAKMIINDGPIDFEIKCDALYTLPLGEYENRQIIMELLQDCIVSTDVAKTCDKEGEVEIRKVGDNENLCIAYNVQMSTTITLPDKLYAIVKEKIGYVSKTVTCPIMISSKPISNKITSCYDPSVTNLLPEGYSNLSSYQEKQYKECLSKKYNGYKFTADDLRVINKSYTCKSEEVWLDKTKNESICDPNILSETVQDQYVGRCYPKGESVIREKQLTGNQYQTTGAEAPNAYCIQPGKKYKDSQKHYVDATYDISKCNSSNTSLECGLASILNAGMEKKYDYATILTALRLWTAHKTAGVGDGWWESLGGGKVLTSTEKIYLETANAVMTEGYQGYEWKDGYKDSKTSPVLYAKNGAGVLSNAISLFKDCNSGKLTPVKGGVSADKTNVNLNNGGTLITITTPAAITNVVPNNKNVKAVIESSTQAGQSFYTKVRLSADDPKCNIKDFSLSIFSDGAIGGMKRYRPSAGSSYQSMFVYDKNSKDASLNFTTSCSSAGACPTPLEVKIDVPEDCKKDGNVGQITDPTLDEILDPCRDNGPENAKKELYNVTTKYSKINSYARLYCREEVDLTFFDVVSGKSGMYFEHKLPGEIAGSISSVVAEGKKECETIIDYNKWKIEFEKAQDHVLSTWTNMKKWEALKNKPNGPVTKTASDRDGARYCDSEPCGTEPCPTASELNKTCTKYCPTDWRSAVSDSCSAVIYSWGSAGYPTWSKIGKGSATASIVYHGTAQMSCSTCRDGNRCIDGCVNGDSGYAEQQYNSAVSAFNSARKVREQLYIDLQNYNLYTILKVMDSTAGADLTILQTKLVNTYADEYKSALGEVEYNDEKYGKTVKIASKVGTTDTYYEAPSYCVGCTKTTDMGANTTEKVNYYLCDTSSCSIVSINVPKNTRATMQTSIEADYYQDQKYYQQAYTGNVAVGSAPATNYVSLKEHIFPIDVKVKSGSFPITAKYGDIIARFEKPLITMETNYSGTYKCYYDAYNEILEYPPSSPLGFIFRQIDLKSIFPNIRVKGANWSTTDAIRVIKEVETLGDDLWITSTPDYSFTLTPEDRRKIKSYNADKASLNVGYTDMSLICEAGNIRCKSRFLDTTSISNYASKYSITNGRSNWR